MIIKNYRMVDYGILMGVFFVIIIPSFIIIMLLFRKGKVLIAIAKVLVSIMTWSVFVGSILILNWGVFIQAQLIFNGTKTIGTTGIPRETTEDVFVKPGTMIPGYHVDVPRHATTVLFHDQNGELQGQQIFIRADEFNQGTHGREVTLYYDPANPKEVFIPTALYYFYSIGIPFYMILLGFVVLEIAILFYILWRRFRKSKKQQQGVPFKPLISIPNKKNLP